MTARERMAAAVAAAKSGNWLIRFGDNPDPSKATAHGGFRWQPLGEWTEAPDWNPKPECGGGLHGQDKDCGGYRHDAGPHVYFCDTDGPHVGLDDKAKVRRARVLLVNALPEGLSVGGWLDLAGCTGLTALPEGLSVGGSLYLSGCTGLTALPEGLSVGGSLDLSGCTGLTALPEGLSVGGSLYLAGCTGLLESARRAFYSVAAARKAVSR